MIADVDVIIPVRNGGKLLADAVDSVLTQDGVSAQVIVVDDGSTDGAPARLAVDRRIQVISNRGRGIPSALNTAIAASDAPLLARQDADDRSLPGRLVAEAEHLERHDGIGLVSTAFEVIVGDRVVATMGPGPAGMIDKNPLCAGATMVRRQVMIDAGNYREVFRLSSDYDAWLRCAWISGLSVLPVVGYQYRLSAGMSSIARAGQQQHFAELARRSARARMAGVPDPVDIDGIDGMDGIDGIDGIDAMEDVVGGAIAGRDEAAGEIAAWWAREFAALGARREAWRCLRRSATLLPARRWLSLVRVVMSHPTPQAVWS